MSKALQLQMWPHHWQMTIQLVKSGTKKLYIQPMTDDERLVSGICLVLHMNVACVDKDLLFCTVFSCLIRNFCFLMPRLVLSAPSKFSRKHRRNVKNSSPPH